MSASAARCTRSSCLLVCTRSRCVHALALVGLAITLTGGGFGATRALACVFGDADEEAFDADGTGAHAGDGSSPAARGRTARGPAALRRVWACSLRSPHGSMCGSLGAMSRLAAAHHASGRLNECAASSLLTWPAVGSTQRSIAGDGRRQRAALRVSGTWKARLRRSIARRVARRPRRAVCRRSGTRALKTSAGCQCG